MTSQQLPADGLLYNPDVTSQEEIDKYRAYYSATKGYSLPAFEFWLDLRPDVLKRYRANFVRETTSVEEKPRPLAHVLAMLHHYAIVGYEDGILYEIKLGRAEGATRGETLDTLAFAFINGGPWGMRFVATSSMEYMKGWMAEEPAESTHPGRWPANWSFNRDAFKSGVDFSVPEASPDDIVKMRDWYQNTLGEVPKYVRFLLKHRPNFLKAFRNRFEHALRDGLPAQMVPYFLLNLQASRGFHDGIREAVLLGRALGMTRPQLVDAITWAYYGGMGSIGVAEEAAGDILASM